MSPKTRSKVSQTAQTAQNEPKVAKAARKTRGLGTFTKMPIKSAGVAAVVAVRKEVNPYILNKRLQGYSPAEFKEFYTLAGITPRRARTLRNGSAIEDHRLWAIETWADWCADDDQTCFTCTLKRLAEEFERKFHFKRALSTLSRYLPKGTFVKPKGRYIKPCNCPEFHWKKVSAGTR